MAGIIKPGDARFANGGPTPPADQRPLVAVCVPSGDMVHADFTIALVQMLFASNAFARTAVLNMKGSAISLSRNLLAAMTLEHPVRFDYLLFVDSDLVFPPDALVRLLRSGRSIVGATYSRRVPPYDVLGRLRPDTGRDLTKGGVHEAEALPAGMMLIRAGVLRQLQQPWFFETYDYTREPPFTSEDYGFCDKARAAGMTIWCDLTLSEQIAHLGQHAIRMAPLDTAAAPAAEPINA